MKRTLFGDIEAQARRKMVARDGFGRMIEFVSSMPHDQRTRQEHPYSYSPFYIWRDRSIPKGQYGPDAADVSGEYSDRLWQWDHGKFEAAREAIGRKTFSAYTREEASAFLTHYFGRPVEAVALAEGCNVSNGYPYWIFWHRPVKAEAEGEAS